MNIVVFGLAGVGVLLMAYAVVTGVVAVRSRGWPVVNGRITQSELAMDREYGRQLQSGQVQLRFAYEYEVDGEVYTGRRVSLGNTAVLPKFALHRTLSTYQPGMDVPVYYAPNRPTLALLEPGFKGSILIPAVVGLLLMAPSLFLLLI